MQPPPLVVLYSVTTDYLRTMGIRRLGGRDLDARDTLTALVNSGRRREIGVRVALGASRARVMGLVLGVLATVALARVLSQIVYLASSGEPIVLGGVTAVMLLVVAACRVRPSGRCESSRCSR